MSATAGAGGSRARAVCALTAVALSTGLAATILTALAEREQEARADAAALSPERVLRRIEPPPPIEPALLDVSASGDVTLGHSGIFPAGGAVALRAGIRRYLVGDLVIGNL